ncbi:MAG: carbohydrate kinase family protein [Chthoniobacteraceae bacterium]
MLLTEAPLVTLGGNGGNAAYVAACSGAKVQLLTNIGEDAFGAMVRGWLAATGCRVLSSKKSHRTAINITAANARHARATFFYPGSPPALPAARDLPVNTTHFLVCGWPHPPFAQLERCLRVLKRKRVFTAMDTGPFLDRPWSMEELKSLFASLHLLLANEYELNALTRSTSLAISLSKLRKHFHGHLVVKRGSRGVLWLPEFSDESHNIKAPTVQAVNTVGAGDSFNGSLLAALAQKKEFPQALTYAVKMAARVVASKDGVLGAKD